MAKEPQTLEQAVESAEGILHRTAMSIGTRTDAETERNFRFSIDMAMTGIRHAMQSLQLNSGSVTQKQVIEGAIVGTSHHEGDGQSEDSNTIQWNDGADLADFIRSEVLENSANAGKRIRIVIEVLESVTKN